MTKFKLARFDGQQTLLRVDPILNANNTASARNAYGTAAQIIVCDKLGLSPIKTDGRFEVCFDAERNGEFFEIKSVHKSGKLVIYDFRMEKEMRASTTANYAVLVHGLRNARSDILKLLREASLFILVLPIARVFEISRRFPLRSCPVGKYSPRDGFTRGGYAKGYRNIPIAALIKAYAPVATHSTS